MEGVKLSLQPAVLSQEGIQLLFSATQEIFALITKRSREGREGYRCCSQLDRRYLPSSQKGAGKEGRVPAAALNYTGDICPHHKKEQGRKGGLLLLLSATQEIFALITKRSREGRAGYRCCSQLHRRYLPSSQKGAGKEGRVTAAALSYTADICPHHKKEQGRKGGLLLLLSATQEIFALITEKEPGRKGEELPFSPGPSK
jgi:hypothetical protein